MSNYDEMREAVCKANIDLVGAGLVTLTWGNVSAVDRGRDVMAIKPSGVDYAALTPDDIVVLRLSTGETVSGTLNPSSDTPTHRALCMAFPTVGAVVHTHSPCATAFAQAGRAIPCLGTTHADHFRGAVPVVRPLRPDEIAEDYETHIGLSIVDDFHSAGIDPDETPAALAPGHGPFVWGGSLKKALENAIVLEQVARMAWMTLQINPETVMQHELMEKHFTRKHGPNAYYGQADR